MSTTVSMKMRLYALPIDEGKNFVLEDLASNLDSMSIAKFPASSYMSVTAPVNVGLILSVRVPLPDDAAFTYALDYTYCRMSYTGSDDVQRDYLYFIDDIAREGNNVLRLSLRMDCLNTFYHLWKNAFSDKTRIIRQHEDRFISGNHILEGTIMMKVDPIGEGINPPLYTISKRAIEQEGYDSRWSMRFEKDLTPEEYTGTGTTNSVWVCLFPQQPNNIIDYVYSIGESPLDAIGPYIRTADSSVSRPRQSSKLIKEIQCPYCPAPIKAGYVPSALVNAIHISGFHYEKSTGIGATALTAIITADYKKTMQSKVKVDNVLTLTSLDTPALSKARKLKDPKLYNSEFHSFSYLYDIYSWSPQIERVVPALYGDQGQPAIYRVSFGIYYLQSMDFSGNLAFQFKLNDGTFPGKYIYPEDYEGLLTCNRNNDHVLFYDEYIEYMRLGYNYDKKTAISSDIGAWTGFTAGLITTAIGIATQNPVVAAGGIVGSVAGFINAVKTTVDNENMLNRKQEEAKRKGANPQNVGDASLLYGYNENKLWMVEKSVSPTMEKMVDDLFYYYGYARGYYGTPNLNSRVYFNFIQCEAVFHDLVIPRFSLTDIAAKLAEGVTVFHYVGGDYHLAQTYENYESALLS